MFIIVEEANKRMGDDFVGAQPGGEAGDDDLLVFVARKVTVGDDARVEVVFVGQDRVERETLEDRLVGLGCLVIAVCLVGPIITGGWGFGHCHSPLQIGMCWGWISAWQVCANIVDFRILVAKNRPRNSIIAHFSEKSNSFLGFCGSGAG